MLSKKLNEYGDQFEYLYIHIQKAKRIEDDQKSQAHDSVKTCSKYHE